MQLFIQIESHKLESWLGIFFLYCRQSTNIYFEIIFIKLQTLKIGAKQASKHILYLENYKHFDKITLFFFLEFLYLKDYTCSMYSRMYFVISFFFFFSFLNFISLNLSIFFLFYKIEFLNYINIVKTKILNVYHFQIIFKSLGIRNSPFRSHYPTSVDITQVIQDQHQGPLCRSKANKLLALCRLNRKVSHYVIIRILVLSQNNVAPK